MTAGYLRKKLLDFGGKMSKSISQSNERKVGVILSYVQIALSSVCSLLYTPIMLRLMGQNEYGLYGTVNSLSNPGFSAVRSVRVLPAL